MIVAITTRGHGDTLVSLSNGSFGFPVPKFVMESYDKLLCARRVPRATYIFTDLERLAPWELRGAGELYRTLTEQGLRCLNDPARHGARRVCGRYMRLASIPLMFCAQRNGRNLRDSRSCCATRTTIGGLCPTSLIARTNSTGHWYYYAPQECRCAGYS